MEEEQYKIGSQICLERSKMNCAIILLCTLRNKDTALPVPSKQWQLNGQTIFTGESGMMNTDFLMTGDNMLLSPGLIYPTPVRLSLEYVQINLCSHNVTMADLLPDGVSRLNFKDRLFDLVKGQWTCRLNNSLGTASAITYISECGK